MADYPIPPWLQVTPAQFGEASRAATALALRAAQLQQDAQNANMNAALRSREIDMQSSVHAQQLQQDAMRAQQEIEMQKAYHTAQIGLKQQELNMEAEATSRRYAANQRYQQLIQSGVDPSTAMLEVGPDLGISMTGAAQLARESQPWEPSIVTIDGERFGMTSPRSAEVLKKAGIPEGVPTATPLRDESGNEVPGFTSIKMPDGRYEVRTIPKKELSEAEQEIKEMEKDEQWGIYLKSGKEPIGDKTKAAFAPIKQRYDQLKQQAQSAPPIPSDVGTTSGTGTSQEVRRWDPKSGRYVIFDSVTHKAIRYAD